MAELVQNFLLEEQREASCRESRRALPLLGRDSVSAPAPEIAAEDLGSPLGDSDKARLCLPGTPLSTQSPPCFSLELFSPAPPQPPSALRRRVFRNVDSSEDNPFSRKKRKEWEGSALGKTASVPSDAGGLHSQVVESLSGSLGEKEPLRARKAEDCAVSEREWLTATSSATESRRRLPVWQRREDLRRAVESSQVVLVVAETGSGKTTQVPQLLLEWQVSPRGWIGVTQPRRVAAVSLARRVASELGEKGPGGLVGYTVRFESRLCSRTRIRFLTDGMLVREAMCDPRLKRFGVLVLDEVHERSLPTDLLLGFAKRLVALRPELKLVLMSATLQAERFEAFFPEAVVVRVEGSTFPVEFFYTPEPEQDFLDVRRCQASPLLRVARRGGGWWILEKSEGSLPQGCVLTQAAAVAVLQLHFSEAQGDVLVFLPGQEEIEALAATLRSKAKLLAAYVASRRQACEDGEEEASVVQVRIGDEVVGLSQVSRLLVCPLYASLPFDRQQHVLSPAPAGTRKVVLATNIAETSVTVPGIRFVVDSGLRKAKLRNPRLQTDALVLQASSAARLLEKWKKELLRLLASTEKARGKRSLRLQEVSKDSATQRAGRAGREGPGQVYRLYTEECFLQMQNHKTPEILACDLSQLYLQLKVLGEDNPLDFPFVDPPSRDAFAAAARNLHRLEAIDAKGNLTALGRKLAELPLSPEQGALLLAAEEMECLDAALTLTAMLSTDNVWQTQLGLSGSSAAAALGRARRRLVDPLSDHATLVNAYQLWAAASDPEAFCKEVGLHHSAMLRARSILDQLSLLLQKMGCAGTKDSGRALAAVDAQEKRRLQRETSVRLRRCLAKTCWKQAARLQEEGRSFVTAVQRQVAKVHPTSVLCGALKLPGWVIYSELVQTSHSYMRCVSAVEASWLQELAPKWFTTLKG